MIINNWKMNYENYKDLECTVPCTMYGTLLSHGLIDDPFYGVNEQKYTSYSEKDCEFKTSFTVSEDILKKDYIYLDFYGLDTLCDIYLNGKKLAYTSNMHRKYSFDVKSLVCGENNLLLHFKSPIEYALKMNNKHFIWNNPDTLPGAAHLRKSICMFGWDWAPKLPDMGIFRKVELDAYDTDKIEDVLVVQNHESGKVILEVSVETRHNTDSDIYVSIDGQRVKVQDGKAEISIDNPKLWWVRGYGDQPLYTLDVELISEGKVIDKNSRRIGLRTLTVSTYRVDMEGEFCFVNNGVKIFAMGANYIPQDSILSRTSADKTKQLINACVDANYNCIRIWGGGYYPDDDFYDLCDELGIIIWQDFMTACYSFRLTDEYRENYTQEAIYNIKRFRNHACLGIFCGNNELERNIAKWSDALGGEVAKSDYIELFERILPRLCDKLAPQTFYWPSSPSSGDGTLIANLTDSEVIGDSHFYTPLVDYTEHKFRFCSEYGFQSFPPYKTICSFLDKKDMNPFSRAMENHQKSRIGNKTVFGYIADTYLLPTNISDTAYASQLFQANAIRSAVEHFRSIRGTCMGSLYWQLNDCWPVASWSSLDYYGRYKALYYYAKRFYAPVTLGLFLKDGKLRVNVSNEQMTGFSGKVTVKLCRSDFSVFFEKSESISLDRLSSEDVMNVKLSPEDEYSDFAVVTLTDDNGDILAKRTELFVQPKHFEFAKPDISVRIEKNKIYVKSDVFAKDVYVDFANYDIILSDNYFDLTDQDEYQITFTADLSPDELMKELQIKTVYDIGK